MSKGKDIESDFERIMKEIKEISDMLDQVIEGNKVISKLLKENGQRIEGNGQKIRFLGQRLNGYKPFYVREVEHSADFIGGRLKTTGWRH